MENSVESFFYMLDFLLYINSLPVLYIDLKIRIVPLFLPSGGSAGAHAHFDGGGAGSGLTVIT